MATYNARCIIGGYWEEYRRVYVDERLSLMPYAQAGTLYKDGEVQLISYDTLVCYTDHGYLYCTGTYSNSTRKHIGAWLKEHFPMLSYYDMKYCYLYDCCVKFDGTEIVSNETGEVFDNWKDAERDYKARQREMN